MLTALVTMLLTQPVLGPPVQVAPEQPGRAPGAQQPLCLAVSQLSGRAMVVWRDRGALLGAARYTMVDPDGRVADPKGRPTPEWYGLDCAWGGRSLGGVFLLRGDDGFQRYDDNGTPLGLPVVVPLAVGPMAVSSDGEDFLLVWTGSAGAVSGLRVSAQGAVGGATLQVSSAGTGSSLAAAWNPSLLQHLVAWPQPNGATGVDLFGRTVDAAGTLGPTTALVTAPGSQDSVRVVSAAPTTGWLLAWLDTTSTYYARGAFVSGALGVSATLSPGATGSTVCEPVWEGSTGSLLWDSQTAGLDRLTATRVSFAGGIVADGGVVVSSGPVREARAAQRDGGTLIAWSDSQNGQSEQDVYVSRLDPALSRLDGQGVLLGWVNASQVNPSVATDGRDFLVAWEEQPLDAGSLLLARRYDSAGLPLDQLTVSTGTSTRQQPLTVWLAGAYLVVWYDAIALEFQAARVLPDGSVLPTALHVPADRTPPATLVTDGTQAYLSWSDDQHVYSRRLDALGNPVDAADVLLVTTLPGIYDLSATGTVSGATLCWHDSRRAGGPDIYAARLGADGVGLDGAGVLLTPPASNGPETPGIGFDGHRELVLWHDHRLVNGLLFGTRLENGAALDAPGVQFFDGGTEQSWPRFDHVGDALWTAWTEGSSVRLGAIFGTRFSPESLLSSASDRSGSQRLAVNQFGGLVAMTVYDGGSFVVTTRAFVSGAAGATCVEPWDCQTGLCLAGVCTAPTFDGGTGGGTAGGPGGGAGGGAAGAGGQSGADGGHQPRRLAVGCGCSTPGGALALLVVSVLWRRRRARHG